MTTPEIVIIITTSGAAIVTVINSIASGWGRKEIKQTAEIVKQTAKDTHEDIVNKVEETKAMVMETTNGNLSILTKKIDKLSDRVGNIELWMSTERTARTRSTDQ